MKTVELIELDDGEVGFQIPEEIIDQLNITEHTKVFMSVEDNTIIVKFEN